VVVGVFRFVCVAGVNADGDGLNEDDNDVEEFVLVVSMNLDG
jgi:hypothetical protein